MEFALSPNCTPSDRYSRGPLNPDQETSLGHTKNSQKLIQPGSANPRTRFSQKRIFDQVKCNMRRNLTALRGRSLDALPA